MEIPNWISNVNFFYEIYRIEGISYGENHKLQKDKSFLVFAFTSTVLEAGAKMGFLKSLAFWGIEGHRSSWKSKGQQKERPS